MKFFRKIVIGISSIVFTTVALSSTTYAWFKINSRSIVDGFNFKMTGGLGFKVSIDGVTYSNDLTADQIYDAMVAKYAPDRFAIHYDESLGKGVLYNIHQEEEKDNLGNTVYLDDANTIPSMITFYDQPTSYSDREAAREKIQLMPVTTSNGVDMEDLFQAKATASSGRYIEFDVYFKTVSQTGYRKALSYDPETAYYTWDSGQNKYVSVPGVNENNYFNYFTFNGSEKLYDIYLNGDTTYYDSVSQKESSVSPTSFTSGIATPVQLSADLVTVIGGIPVTKHKGDTVNVYGANAIRLSITDNSKYDPNSNTGEGVLVYELNDSQNASSNLGSYATKYSEQYCIDNGIDGYTTDQEYLYNYNYSASYTYYSNLKGAIDYEHSSLYSKLYDYKNGIPSKTIKFDDLLRDGNNNYSNNKVITTLSSDANNPTILTFKIWLEGWDADCFDGIAGNINALLSFIAIPH